VGEADEGLFPGHLGEFLWMLGVVVRITWCKRPTFNGANVLQWL